MRSGITRRWLRGSLLITVLLVLLVEVMFLYSATRSYYNGVQQTMYRRFSSITGQLKMYTGETSQKTAASRSVALRRMVEQFSDKDKYEFMLLDSYGGVIASSSGTDAEGIVTRTDFEQAQDAVDGQGIAIYRTQSGEMVMAACCLVPYAAEDVAAMRLVTSLTLVEEQLKRAPQASARQAYNWGALFFVTPNSSAAAAVFLDLDKDLSLSTAPKAFSSVHSTAHSYSSCK